MTLTKLTSKAFKIKLKDPNLLNHLEQVLALVFALLVYLYKKGKRQKQRESRKLHIL